MSWPLSSRRSKTTTARWMTRLHPRAIIYLSEETKKEEKIAEILERDKQNLSSDKLHDNHIKFWEDEDEDSDTDHAAASSKQKPTDKNIPICPRQAPKSSTFNKCKTLLHFLRTATWKLFVCPMVLSQSMGDQRGMPCQELLSP